MRIRILSLFLLALAACSSGQLPTPQASPVLPLASVTPAETQAPTSVPTLAPTVTSSAAPSPTTARSPLPTPSDMEQPALELLRTNNGCLLPCWWGITPGKTRWSDAEAFLAPFSHVFAQDLGAWSVAEVRSPIDKQYSPLIGEVRMTFGIQDKVVQEIDAYEFDEASWRLDSFLQQLGPPSYAYISTYSRDLGLPTNLPFSIALFYPDDGLLATYGTAEARVVGSTIRACLKSPSLFLWDPDHRVTFEYASQWKDAFYLPLQQATGVSVDQFYEAYKDGNVDACIETPANLWPEQ